MSWWDLKAGNVLHWRMSCGSVSQSRCPDTEKWRSPRVVSVRGTDNKSSLNERRGKARGEGEDATKYGNNRCLWYKYIQVQVLHRLWKCQFWSVGDCDDKGVWRLGSQEAPVFRPMCCKAVTRYAMADSTAGGPMPVCRGLFWHLCRTVTFFL